MAVLRMAQRKALPAKSFALPGKGEGPSGKGAGSYPIPDASHARNALARVSQHGTSEEKAIVRRKVKAKFPGIAQAGGTKKRNSNPGTPKGTPKGPTGKLSSMLRARMR